jgi:hypothetical protein
MVRVIDPEDDAAVADRVFEEYVTGLRENKTVGCLFVYNEPRYYKDNGATVFEAMHYLAQRISAFAGVPADRLLRGGNLNKQMILRCPVTNEEVLFPDFEGIACCPQAMDKSDPLYDPFVYAPYPCVNMNSDIHGFAMLVRDRCLAEHHCGVYELGDVGVIQTFLSKCEGLWHGLALQTLKGYIKATDVNLCPAHMSGDNSYWYSNHRDTDFAEIDKLFFVHEMPKVYAKRLIAQWVNFFANGIIPDYTGITKPGSRQVCD